MLYRGRYRIATFEESVGLATTTGLVGRNSRSGLPQPQRRPARFPRAVAVLTPPVALLSMAADRLAFRACATGSRPTWTPKRS